jgi:hypothetical protein
MMKKLFLAIICLTLVSVGFSRSYFSIIQEELLNRKSFEIHGDLPFEEMAKAFEESEGIVTIQIGFTGSNSWISRAIKAAQRTKYSHNYIRYSFNNRHWVFEADQNGVVRIDYDEYLKNKMTFHKEIELEITDSRFLDLQDFITDNIRKPYHYTQLFWILFKLRFVGNKDGERRYICSELVARALEDILWPHGYDPKQYKGKTLDKWTPRDMYELLVQRGYISEDDSTWKKRLTLYGDFE